MKRSSERIITTHVGSLARPPDLLEMMRARLAGEAVDEAAFRERARRAVHESVARQVECGIDVVSDGEQSKTSFYAYLSDRLSGFEEREPRQRPPREGDRGFRIPHTYAQQANWPKEIRAFQDYYETYYYARRAAGRIGRDPALVCTGPVTYTGQAQLQEDIATLKAAAVAADAPEAFMPATAPQGHGANEYYATDEEYIFAMAEALHEEYAAIVEAGLVLQVDDPVLTTFYARDDWTPEEQRKGAELYVEALNHALRGIDPEMVRFHTCYGINEGPRVHDVPLSEIAGLLLRINASAYSFEAGNPRHEHEWHVFEDVKLPEGKLLIPGIISHTTNVVEHPEAVADRILNFARVAGRENVIAGADCGFSSNATFTPDVHPSVVWAKFEALAEGARLASRKLWR